MDSGVLLASWGENAFVLVAKMKETNKLPLMGAGNQEQQMAEISYPPLIFV